MKKVVRNLIATVIMLAIVTVMICSVTYAWFTISDAPEISGIRISLAGNNTILIAPDISSVAEDGTVYHYPGAFLQAVDFDRYDQYNYLGELAGLSPVSTADGLHWYIPTYYGANDADVINGTASAGQLKPIDRFEEDTVLTYANLGVDSSSSAERGSYVYLDFWVVSPSADYDLRVAQGEDGAAGSFLIELPEAQKDSDGSLKLSSVTVGSAASSARVGFLVNYDTAGSSDEYAYLRGVYQELGDSVMHYSSSYRFTIYEPNGDLHPNGEDGTYSVTAPIAWSGTGVTLADISDRLTVQMTSSWSTADGAQRYIDELFAAFMATKGKGLADDEINKKFYDEYLRGQLLSYVNKGNFIASTASLYAAASENGGKVDADDLGQLESAGATSDTYVVRLEQNVPQRIRMFVWIEGQDEDCLRDAGDVSFALGIELAGSQINTGNGKTKQEEQ